MDRSAEWDKAPQVVLEGQRALDELQRRAAPVTKPSNPKDRVGITKLAFSVFPLPVLWETCLGMFEGALKYGRHNYREAGVRGSVYFDATFRHLSSWWEGEDTDPDSGLNHITKAITSLVVLRDSMIRGNWVDDRPPKSSNVLIHQANQAVKDLINKYPDPVEPFTEQNYQQPRGTK